MGNEINYNNGQKDFELFIVDSDTALFTAAKYVQEDYVVVKSKLTGVEREFKNKTTFLGTKKSGDIGGWMGELNTWLGTTFNRDDFEVTQMTRLRTDITNHLEEAEKQFAYFVRGIKALELAKDYRLCIGGEGNFRYDIAKILPYKGMRKEKPLIFSELKTKVCSQYKSKIILANNCESDDTLGIYGAKSQSNFRKTGKYLYVLGYTDKDIRQIWGPTVFLNNKEAGIKFLTPMEAAHHFAFQLLKGDKTVDNIQGLPGLAQETREKYRIRNTVGCGEVAATAILEGCTEIKELFERVVECYKAYYVDPVMVQGVEYTWKDFLRENAILLWMMRTPDQRFDIFVDLLDPYGVVYE